MFKNSDAALTKLINAELLLRCGTSKSKDGANETSKTVVNSPINAGNITRYK